MRSDASDRFEVTPGLCVIAAATLGGVLQWTNGHYNARAILVVTAAWLLTLTALFGRFRTPRKWLNERAILIAIGASLATQLALLIAEPPTLEMSVPHPGQMHLFNALVVLVALLTGVGLSSAEPLQAAPPRATIASRAWLPGIVLLHFVMGALVIGFVASPHIDVWLVEMDSARALLHGQNPFGITFPNLYGAATPFYPPEAFVNGRLMFGFVYPPLCLLMCLPGYLLGGDTRWSTLVAMELAALLLAYARPGKLAKLCAVGFLFMPRTFFVMDRAWTDSFIVLLTAAVCFTSLRRPRWAFVFIGLYVCLKQQMFLGIPALFMLLPRPIPWKAAARLTLKGGAVAAVVTLPLVLWDARAFSRSALDIREVFRTDSLGLLAHLHNTGVITLSKWTGLLAVLPVIVIGLWRAPRTPAGFALFAAATHYTLYIFSTHAFCNEYYNVVGALYAAAAVWGPYDGRALVDEAPPKAERSVTAGARRTACVVGSTQ